MDRSPQYRQASPSPGSKNSEGGGKRCPRAEGREAREIRESRTKKRQCWRKDTATLHRDKTFPPDQSSLTYVYSGDDKYEKMVFKRPRVCTENFLIVII